MIAWIGGRDDAERPLRRLRLTTSLMDFDPILPCAGRRRSEAHSPDRLVLRVHPLLVVLQRALITLGEERWATGERPPIIGRKQPVDAHPVERLQPWRRRRVVGK